MNAYTAYKLEFSIGISRKLRPSLTRCCVGREIIYRFSNDVLGILVIGTDLLGILVIGTVYLGRGCVRRRGCNEFVHRLEVGQRLTSSGYHGTYKSFPLISFFFARHEQTAMTMMTTITIARSAKVAPTTISTAGTSCNEA